MRYANQKGSIMLKQYVRAAMKKARYEILPDDSSFYGEIPGLQGVYANADTLEECRDELEEVLEDWILLRVSLHYPVPSIDGIQLTVGEVA
jgi:predicted RNase H-like HicB family nuclease